MWQARLFKVSFPKKLFKVPLQKTSSRGALQKTSSRGVFKVSIQRVSSKDISKVCKRFGQAPALLRSLYSAHDLVDQGLHGNIVRYGRVIEADPVAEDLMAELLHVVRGDIGAAVHQGGSLGDL